MRTITPTSVNVRGWGAPVWNRWTFGFKYLNQNAGHTLMIYVGPFGWTVWREKPQKIG